VIQPNAPKQPTAEELGAALTGKQLALAEAYLETFSPAVAGRMAKYENRSNATRALKHKKVQAYLSARMADRCMPANEVLARLSSYARVTGDLLTKEEEYEVPVFEARPLREKIDALQARVGALNNIDPGLLKNRIEATQAEIAELEVQLALEPGATYQKQVGTETRTRIIPSLEAAAENGVLFAVDGLEYTQHGLKWKRVDSVKALELIGKHHKLFTEKVEHSGTVDAIIGIDFIMPGGDS